ncbi:PLP-dependent transferase [Stemphylium lycopersici]|uniref:PLP-dependent transferase n=1 Tax=Stemphylium lycopersici TaxID=183478 RepID=A0A364NAP5_STELY|nr:glutamate decarboxylase 1 [Stemphylium lycopersici]RAR09547.1 PLP-dependent transferase [Stemphylium lycopersici]RAR14243.1 PLP-dependent transferase [Stemphylium lycopersici]
MSAASPNTPLNRADEVKDLLDAVQELIIPFIRSADEDAATKHNGHGLKIEGGGPRTALVEHHPPKKLESILSEELEINEKKTGKDGLVKLVSSVLKYSVNTWDQGFLDKLYASTNAVGVVSELLLAVLNTNSHVYQVSPVLTLVEKRTTKYIASLFGLPSQTSGGISQPGGSASNSTAIVVARNTLYPSTKTDGNGAHKFTIFTSAHGHYSVEKAANLFGLGSKNVIAVPVDSRGCMIPSELERCIKESKERGETPFFLNATAGTTVHGSFDPFAALAPICKTHNLWFHIDGSWGGSVVFNAEYAASRLAGADLADSITINPHKMLGVPMTCSFLLARDMNTFYRALTLPAGYLFHNAPGTDAADIYDLADLTPQCGRRADSLKMWLALQYYGPKHFSDLVANGYKNGEYLLEQLKRNGNFKTISPEPLPCLQVCFYYARAGVLGSDADTNSEVTTQIAHRLISRGFMIDFAPGKEGKFFRVVVNGGLVRGTLDGLVKALEEAAKELGY